MRCCESLQEGPPVESPCTVLRMVRLVFDDAGETKASDPAPSAPPTGEDAPRSRSRSRSLGRARKRQRFELQSQQDCDETELPPVPERSAGSTQVHLDADAPKPKSLFRYYYRLQRVVTLPEW